MDRVWLRDYESILSSNRRPIDIRPLSADISNNRVKKGRTERMKKRKDNFTSEVDVARQLRAVRTDMDGYDKSHLEKQERDNFQQKIENQQLKKKSSKNKIQVSFKKLTTFDEFKEVENRREQCFATGDSEIFHSLYPDIEHHMSHFKLTTNGIKNRIRPKSPSTRSKAVLPYQMTCANEDESSSRPERPTAQFDISLAKQALQLWKEALTALRLRGKEIVYEDVSKFSKKWKRSASLRPLVVYISILLGLKSGDPAVTQRSLFRELYSLLKFFREVNPLTIPKRRIMKANTFHGNSIEQKNDSGIQLYTNDAENFEMNILGWVGAMQTIFGIILNAKHHHEIMNANFDEKLCEIEAENMMDPMSTTPFKHLQTRTGTRMAMKTGGGGGGGPEETPKQERHRLAKLSPTGTWSTRLTSPAQMAAEEMEKLKGLNLSMSEEGLSAFDSTAIQSFLEVSQSANIPLEDLSLEYSPDRPSPCSSAFSSTNTNTSTHNNKHNNNTQSTSSNTDTNSFRELRIQTDRSSDGNDNNDPHEDFVNRQMAQQS